MIAAVRYRVGTGNAVACQMRHQIQIKWQLISAENFEQREYKAAIAGGDEIVGILDAGCDALQFHKLTQGIIAQPGSEFSLGDAGKNRHT